MVSFGENVQKPQFLTLNPLNPRIKIFFQNSGPNTFFTLLIPNFMQNFKKNNKRSLRYLKTDTHTDHKDDY